MQLMKECRGGVDGRVVGEVRAGLGGRVAGELESNEDGRAGKDQRAGLDTDSRGGAGQTDGGEEDSINLELELINAINAKDFIKVCFSVFT